MGVKAKGYASDAGSFEDSEKLVNDVIADFGELHPGVRPARAGLVPDGVAVPADQDVVARSGEGAQRDLIGHGPGGQPERRLLAQQRSHALLEEIHGGILAELVVPHRRGGDGRAHRG